MSGKEADATPRDPEPLPGGKYLCAISDVELRFSTSEKHNGDPYYGMQFTVIDDVAAGKYIDRKCWANVMLFEGALYSIVQILKALGYTIDGAGDLEVPEPEWFLGQELVVVGIKKGETKGSDGQTYSPRFEPKSYFPTSAWKSVGSTTAGKATSAAEGVTFLK